MRTTNNILLWSAVFFCAVCVYWMFTEAHQGKQRKEVVIADKVYYAFLAVTALICVGIRVWQFGAVPGGFNQDGAMAAVDARALAEYGTDRYGMRLPVHLTAWGYGQMSALLSYLMVPFIKLFGFHPIAIRMPQLIMSLLAILCLYLFVKDVFGRNMALAAFLFVSINPWQIIQSRWVLDCNLYPQFFMIGVYFLNKGISKKWSLYLSMVFFGLCMYCYGISIYTMPAFLLMSCIYLLVKKEIKVRDALICAGIYLLVGGAFILVMMINFFGWETIQTPLFTLPYFPDSVRSNDILFFSDNIGSQFVQNVKALLNVTLLQEKDLPWNDIEGFGTMYLFSMPFVVLGLVALWKRFRDKRGSMIVLFDLLTGIFCGLLTNGVNVNRNNIIYYPIIILAAVGIYEAVRWVSVSKYVILCTYAAVFCVFAHTYFTSYAEEIQGYFHKDFGSALTAAADADVSRYYITTYCNATDLTEILVQFYCGVDAKFYQGKTKDENGLSFPDKYHIASMAGITPNASEDAAYVVSAEEFSGMDPTGFHVEQFGTFYVLTP